MDELFSQGRHELAHFVLIKASLSKSAFIRTDYSRSLNIVIV